MTRRRADMLFASVMLSYCVLVWWPTRQLPYHWDSATFVARAARDLLARDFSPFIANYSFFAHPPLFIAALALCLKWFGTGLSVGHALLLPFLPLLLLCTYAIGARLYAPAVGAAAAALVATAAVVVAEYGQVYFDLPLAALLALAAWLWFAERRLLAGLVLGVCAAIKIPSLVVPCALLAVAVLRPQPGALRRAWPLAIPFVVVAVWLVYHHSVEGFWLRRPPLRSHVAAGPAELLGNARSVVRYLYTQGRWAAAAIGIGALLVLMVQKRVQLRSAWSSMPAGTLALALIASGGIAFFSLAGEFAERYGIMLMPALALLAALPLHALLSTRPALYWGLIALACGLQCRSWYPEEQAAIQPSLRPDADLHYLDVIALGRETAQYMAREHPTAHVFGSWPETYWLGEPYLGYVARPFAVDDCRNYRADLPGEKVIFGHMYAPEQRRCWKLIGLTGARPVKLLAVGAKWVQVHLVP